MSVLAWFRSTAAAVADRWREGPVDTYHLGEHSFRYRRRSYDRVIIDEVWKKGEYFLDRVTVTSDEAIVDIGAHIGSFAVKAGAQFPGIPIVAVEPVPANFRLLRHNLVRNGCDAVTALNLAVTASPGEVSVYLDPTNTAGHSTVARRSATRVSAEAVTLTRLLESRGIARVGLLKIDCEGAEYEIVQDSPDELWRGVRNLTVEYHPVEGHDFDGLQHCLKRRGFELTAHHDGYFSGQGTALFQKPD